MDMSNRALSMAPEIIMASGNYFNFLEPDKSTIFIYDIAHALANVCRFSGHTRKFYSVAQHSVIVSRIVPPEFALHGLLHDAAEAYIGDVSTPLKQLLPDYRAIEKRVEAAVFNTFNLPRQLPPEVKRADLVLLATEKRDFFPANKGDWDCLAGVVPLADRIVGMEQEAARELFYERFYELWEGRSNAGL